MSIEPLVVPAIVTAAAIGAATLLFNVVGSALYDVRRAKAQQHYRRQPHIRLYRQRPLISIIIPTENDTAVIERCLDSIRRSEYRKFQIIVIDNCSSDKTCDIVGQWMAAHPKRAVRLIAKRLPSPYVSRLRSVSRRHLKGALVMVLEPTATLDAQALTQAVRRFNYQPALDLLLPDRRVATNFTIASLFERYNNLLGQRRQKRNSVAQSEYAPSTEAAIYRLATFRAALQLHHKVQPNERLLSLPLLRLGSQPPSCAYVSDVVVYTAPPTSLRNLLIRRYRTQLGRWQAMSSQWRLFFGRRPAAWTFLAWLLLPVAILRGLLAVLLPVLVSYFIYLAVSLHEPLLLGLSAAVLAGLLLTAIWDDHSLKLRQKLAYIIGIPVTYGLFYLTICLQLLMVLPVIVHRKKALAD